MIYHSSPPPNLLKDYVRCFWWLEGNGNPYIHRGMADVCPEFIFHYKGRFTDLPTNDTSFSSGLHGQSDTFRRFAVYGDFGIFGVYLYPQAVPMLFGFPATELSNQMPDIHSLPGHVYTQLEDRMMLATDNHQRVNIISGFLQQRLHQAQQVPPGISEAIHFMIQSQGALSVADLSRKYFLSERQFERNFKAASGFSPKRFSKIVRFQAALQHYGRQAHTLTALAYDCGYYDQSHFIHDFKTFSGYHPRHYFGTDTEANAWRS